MNDEKIITSQDVIDGLHDEIEALEKRIAELEVMLRRIQEHGVEYDSDIRAIDAVLNNMEAKGE
jgi:septal ring factor EnvC (AmiA/AmiB activator)